MTIVIGQNSNSIYFDIILWKQFKMTFCIIVEDRDFFMGSFKEAYLIQYFRKTVFHIF